MTIFFFCKFTWGWLFVELQKISDKYRFSLDTVSGSVMFTAINSSAED